MRISNIHPYLEMALRVRPFVIDIGGEGRHREAWNLNPRKCKTFGPERGQPIPRLVIGRSESIPLPDQCADTIIVERTPLSRLALAEIRRIARSRALIVLRHAKAFGNDPHRLAKQVLQGDYCQGECRIGHQLYRETIVILDISANHKGEQSTLLVPPSGFGHGITGELRSMGQILQDKSLDSTFANAARPLATCGPGFDDNMEPRPLMSIDHEE